MNWMRALLVTASMVGIQAETSGLDELKDRQSTLYGKATKGYNAHLLLPTR
jgi:hypothetical protein